ncbi:MAG: hypothetical protein ACYC5G_05235 [Candidatus Doudnabacteria bacterium]
MKVKLLKKVRKRYEIVKVTQVSPPISPLRDSYNHWAKEYGLPFFVLIDNENEARQLADPSEGVMFAILKNWIHRDYIKIKNIQTIEEKVWYPKHSK